MYCIISAQSKTVLSIVFKEICIRKPEHFLTSVRVSFYSNGASITSSD